MSKIKIVLILILAIILGFYSQGLFKEEKNPGTVKTSPSINVTSTPAKSAEVVVVDQVLGAEENTLIVDVRRPDEYAAGHLKGAILLTLDTILQKAPEILPDKEKTIYVYCRSGVRSAKAALLLTEMGYKNVRSMDGGILKWQKSGYPLVND